MRRAVPIVLNADQRQVLKTLRQSRTTSVRLAERAAVVLLADQGKQDIEIAVELGICRQTVSCWRKR